MTAENKFWLLMEAGTNPGSKTFPTKEAAEEAAAKQSAHKTTTVFVLEAVEAFKPKPVEVEKVRTVEEPQPAEEPTEEG